MFGPQVDHVGRRLRDAMPRRVMPYVGHPVVVVYLGARLRGVISEVGEEGRLLAVRTEEGETVRFRLNPATAIFESQSARLVFETEPEPE